MGLIKQQRIKKINAGVSRTARAVLLKIGKENLLVSRTFFFIYTHLGAFFPLLEVVQTVRFFCFMCVFVLTICLFCTFGFDIDFFVLFLFTLNLLFSFSLKYLISVQKFDILPSSLQSSVSEGALVSVYV